MAGLVAGSSGSRWVLETGVPLPQFFVLRKGHISLPELS